MSTSPKSLVDRHGEPSRAVPRAGTASLPAPIAVFAAVKNAPALQNANCPKTESSSPFTQFAWASVSSLPRNARLSPLNPNHSPTTAPAGTFGTAGAAAPRGRPSDAHPPPPPPLPRRLFSRLVPTGSPPGSGSTRPHLPGHRFHLVHVSMTTVDVMAGDATPTTNVDCRT